MKLVIDIDDHEYTEIKASAEIFRNKGMTVPHLYKVIESGTVLPKEYGRLIDAEKLAKEINRAWTLWEKKGEDCYLFSDVITPMLVCQQTIIEADKAESEGYKCKRIVNT